MNIFPYATSRLGARITPADPLSTGQYDIGVLANAAPSQFPGCDQILSGSFYPTAIQFGGGLQTVLMEVYVGGTVTQATTPHSYFYCYAGWNQNGLNPDGALLQNRIPVGIGIYNATPYTFAWEIGGTKLMHDSNPVLATPYNNTAIMVVAPGGVITLAGPVSPTVYSSGGIYYYGNTQGVCPINSYLRCALTSAHPAYTYTGYLQVVLLGAPVLPA